MMRRTIPEAWRVEAAEKDLAELRQLMKQYEDEHHEECQGRLADDSEQATVQADEQFMKELEALDGPEESSGGGTDPENEEKATGDGGDEQRYNLQEWIQKEADSYGEYLQQMSGTELIEEYRRQGGEEAAYFDPESEEIVVEEEKEPNERTTD
jgi:hypothetical protein